MTDAPPSTNPPPNLAPCSDAGDLSALRIPHPRPFLARIHVDPGAMSRVIDHVSNTEYLRWLDRAAELHADAVGFTRRRMLDDGLMWFVARHEIDYVAEVRGEDELAVATWVRTMDRAKSWRDYVIVRMSDGAPVCRAATLWVLVRLESRRPVRATPEMIERFDPLARPKERGRKDGQACTSR
ncbi:MAG: acyl-CoA thioesterase [Planctomycetes bacterium]|nr:acyl-CoA thioesterase [Planctomycetota bacterium]